MASRTVNSKQEQINYSRLLSSFLCSVSIVALTILCMLNNLSFDLYAAFVLVKVVFPAALTFWFIGYSIGKIFDKSDNVSVISIKKTGDEKKAYEIPSIFSMDTPQEDEGLDFL